jgi:hypothetical protein
MEGWRQWRLGKKLCPTKKNERTYLTPAGLLMEGVSTTLRFSFAKIGVNECNGDISTVMVQKCSVPKRNPSGVAKKLFKPRDASSQGQPLKGDLNNDLNSHWLAIPCRGAKLPLPHG